MRFAKIGNQFQMQYRKHIGKIQSALSLTKIPRIVPHRAKQKERSWYDLKLSLMVKAKIEDPRLVDQTVMLSYKYLLIGNRKR